MADAEPGPHLQENQDKRQEKEGPGVVDYALDHAAVPAAEGVPAG
jgi:hypothetical protein